MRSTFLKATSRTAALVSAGLLLSAGASSAAAVDVYLQAQSASKTLPGSVEAPMWVFVCDPAVPAGSNPNCVPSAPGSPMPRINAAPGDSLTIYLTNTLPEPVSVVIPGQAGAADPEIVGGRVQSLTHETAAGTVGTPGTGLPYVWGSLRAGTYLYQSGTRPSIQVPMGLYGALVVGPVTDVTCAPPKQPAYASLYSCYDADALLLFSEIDYWQNKRVADAAAAEPLSTACVKLADYDTTAGTPVGYPCTVDYTPTYFLINGNPYDKAAPPPPVALPEGATGKSVLLRFLNAGLRSHTPAIVGLDMGLVAEDGNLYPGLVKQQASTLLPAGKTLDVLVATPVTDATYPLFDRMLDLSNFNQPDGGMLAYLQVGSGSTPPTEPTIYAVNDSYTVPEDAAPYAGATVLSNDVGLSTATVTVVTGPSNGSLTLNADGTFAYTPNLNFSGADGFTYSASLAGNSYPAQVTLNVSVVNDAPVAAADGPYVNAIGASITVAAPGVLANDGDPEGDALTAVIEGVAPAGLALSADGSFTYSGSPGPVTFSYRASDGLLQSGPVEVTLTVNPVANIALNVQEPGGAAVTSYRWLVQEDATYHINPAAPPSPSATLSTNFHRSYMPVVAQGCVVSGDCHADNPSVPVVAFDQAALDPAKHYYVSVLPNDAGTGTGHSIGGARIPPGSAGSTITVIVNKQPIPTAQLAVVVFEDISPTNGVPDPGEPRLGGFQITLEDAGGRYGISGGTMSQDAFGNPLKNSLLGTTACPGTAAAGVILTCPDGTALIKDLPPAKYGIVAVPPAGSGNWTQTTTIEGTKVIDAWVEAGNPPFFVEMGVPSFHAFIGFVNPAHTTVPEELTGNNTITGQVTMAHPARPPDMTSFDSGSYDGLGHTRAWIGLNSSAGTGPSFATVQADPDGSFTIAGIPDGTYQLAIWDQYLDQIIHYRTVILPGGENVGNIPVPTWFGRHEHNVFLDLSGDGIRQEGEPGLPDQNVNLRFRDGSVFQTFPTDTEGFVPFDQIFPFGSWQVAEVDFTRFKPTGVTVTVDGGGDVSGGPYPGLVNPQQGSPGGPELASPRTETGPVLLEGFQSNPGMTAIFEWGKKPYEPGENGGISGIVFYSSTRGENDPRLTVGDPWEPGIPRVKVRLYREVPKNGGGTALSLVQEVQTDSWDDNTPTGCPGEPVDYPPGSGTPNPFTTLIGDNLRCFDGVRNWDQVRPAVFDGGYAFTDLAPGKYVVEVVPPPGYEVYKEEDKNVDFGDSFETIAPVAVMLPGGAMLAATPDQAMVLSVQGAEPGLAQPPCAGPDHLVPSQLSLFPGVDTYAPFAGTMRPLCSRKAVILSDQGQAAADFHLFTSTPVAGQFQGLATDDVAIETNPAAPSFSDKWGPAFLPVSMRDFKGREVYRGYTDAFGRYNGVVPSTFSANIPIPSGYSPGMHFVCLNDPGPVPGPGGALVPDPLQNPKYGVFCFTLMYMPGATTYLDTPMLPQAAFAAGFNPADCAPQDAAPVVAKLQAKGSFAWTDRTDGTETVQIFAQGTTDVPNPAYEGPLATTAPYNQPTVSRTYGFGSTEGTVTFNGVALPVTQWGQTQIKATIPSCATPPCTGQIVVTRADGTSSVNTATLTVTDETDPPIQVTPGPGAIQAAIDAAAPGSLILVPPGTYDELVVMWKPVRLQGSGAGTVINAVKLPAEKLQAWKQKVKQLIDDGFVDLLPGQPADFDLVGGGLFGTEMGAGITVLAKNDPSNTTGLSFLAGTNPSRIDGFTITGADGGGAIFVNGYAHNLEISNNNVTGNAGVLSGGIRIGHPYLQPAGPGPFAYNVGLKIHNNSVTLNGGQSPQGVGGGVALFTGTDNYAVSRNFVCGNFSLGDGGGIGHLGLSDNGVIQFNQVLFNQSFNQGLNRSGGGVLVAGEPPVGGALTLGSGDVTVDANLIQGNQAGSGHGGGVRMQSVNGAEPSPWQVTLTNNMIVNNVAGWSGGGVALQDAINSRIVNNTIANNDSTATVGALVAANNSTPQPAGVASDHHSPALAALVEPDYSDPALFNNIIWHNRAFTYDATAGAAKLLPELSPATIGDCPTATNYLDLGVLGGGSLNPTYSILTDTAGYHGSNLPGDPDFLKGYCNGARTLSAPGSMQVAAEVIEGGNYIDVRYGPLAQAWPATSTPWNYHLGLLSAALGQGTSGGPGWDFDNESRTGPVEIGADEVQPPPGTVAFSPSPGAFGNVPVGTTATLTITATVSVNPIAFASSTNPAAPFGKTADTCSGTTVAVGGTCTFTVSYTPTGTVTSTGSFTVIHDGTGSPQTVNLSGTGVRGTVAYSSGAFGNVLINSTATRTITATVSGYPVTFTSSTNPAAPFAKTGTTCLGTVPAGGTCTFTVTYTPTSTATSNSSFTVSDNAVGSPQTVSLSGTGVRQVAFTGESGPGTLTSTISGGSLAFGNQNGLATNTLTITVNAASPVPVTFGTLTVTNTTGTAFSKGADTCSGTTRAPGSTCTVTVNFAGPAGNSARAGTLSVPHTGVYSPTPLVLNLTGF